MLKVLLGFFFFALLNVSIYAQSYKQKYDIVLKKDKTEKILVKYGNIEKLLTFRWTLYHNEGLVLLRSYDQIVAQNMLYLNHINQSVKIELRSRAGGYTSLPYVILKFVKFNYQTKEASFGLFLFDREDQIELKFLDKETGQG